MNVNEIRDKYCVDKRQTGQNFITPWGSGTSYGSGVGAFNKRKSDLPDTKRYKREQMRAGKDPLIKNKESRDQRALALKIDNAVKQMKSIRDSLKKMNSEYKEKYGSSHVYLGRNGYPED